jgi:hypothetical protein
MVFVKEERPLGLVEMEALWNSPRIGISSGIEIFHDDMDRTIQIAMIEK